MPARDPAFAPGMNRRALLASGLSAFALAAMGPGTAQAAAKPNFLFILVDNLGFGDLSCYAGPIRGVTTPRIDKLAGEGLRLTNFNVEPACTPSRSAFLTGRMPIRSGTSSVNLTGAKDGLAPWEYTLAELLSDAGYATACFGKWHLGSVEERYPTSQGFDEWYGVPRSHEETLWDRQPGYDGSVEHEPVLEGKRGSPSRKVADYTFDFRSRIDREVTNRADAYLKARGRDKKPFFLYVPFTLPHDPPLAHPDLVRKDRSQYQNVLAEIDRNTGVLLDSLKAAGLDKDTIVVFASDNGPQTLAGPGIDYGGQGDTGPFRNEFASAWEGAIRTACIVRWPGHVAAGRVSNEIVSILDFYRTFAAVAGATGRVPSDRAVDSIDQSDFLFANQEKSPREHVMFFHAGELLAVKWRNFKAHQQVREPARGPVVQPGQGVITGERIMLNNGWMFDVENDPKELWNIGSANTWVQHKIGEIRQAYEKSVQKYPNIKPGADGPEAKVPAP